MRRAVEALVIGAGPTGIGAAVRLRELGVEHLVVDAGASAGGMAASRTDAHGFTWDLGGHVIHSHFPDFDDAVRRSGAPLRQVERNGWVWMDGAEPGSMLPSPVQAQLEEMPEDLDPLAPAANLADYYRNCFGSRLFDDFFDPYNRKMWTLPLERIDHSWTSLRSGGSGRNVPRPGLARDRVVSRETFPYPVGGTGALWEAIVRELADPGSFRFGARVVSLDIAARRALLEDGDEIDYRMLVSTAPMTWMLEQMGRPGDAEGLHATTEVAVGLGFEGAPPAALDGVTWVYSPDPKVPWFRGTVLSTYDPSAAGTGRWSMLLEVSDQDGGPIDVESAVRACVRSLEVLGAEPSSLVSTWTEHLPMGYPVPTLGRDDVLRPADSALLEHAVHSRGRFGGWRYESCNQDYSYMQGRQAVDAEVSGAAEDILWQPEKY
jgi:protoporphyrinogen oxidase